MESGSRAGSDCVCASPVSTFRGITMGSWLQWAKREPPSPKLNMQGRLKTCLSEELPYCRNLCFEWTKRLFDLGEEWLLKVRYKNILDSLTNFTVLQNSSPFNYHFKASLIFMDHKNRYGGLNTLSGSACRATWQDMFWQTGPVSTWNLLEQSVIFRKVFVYSILSTMKNLEFTVPDIYAEKKNLYNLICIQPRYHETFPSMRIVASLNSSLVRKCIGNRFQRGYQAK